MDYLNEIVALPVSEGYVMTPLKAIKYAKSNGNYSQAYLKDGTEIFITRQLNELESFLLNCYFLRVHQQYLVNKIYVNQYIKKDSQLVLLSGEKIPVATRKRKLITTFFKTVP